ncbi:aminotransferase class I/II-fold pyridoxal phosphate-dependent enzyme [bacterium]|nr:aminotransferase class I/II-fold pyridoxal phosphate-dependent enzyme [bacterium]
MELRSGRETIPSNDKNYNIELKSNNTMNPANRIKNLPPYLFAGLEEKATKLRGEGVDLIDLGIADPDLPPPKFLVDSVKAHLDDPDAFRYPTSRGDAGVRAAIAKWFKQRFGVELDPGREIVVTLGSKEGLTDLARAVVNPDDTVAVPIPGYPVYGGACAILNDAQPRYLELLPENQFLPKLEDSDGCRVLFLNYPNNPTGQVADEEFYKAAADFAETHPETLVVWDAAYCELSFDDFKSPSILQFTRKAVEMHSLSKMMNCTGYRIGFAVGDADTLDAMVKIKTQVDSGAPVFIQRAMAEALSRYDGKNPPEECLQSHREYGERKKKLEIGLLDVHGVKRVYPSPSTFFVWMRVANDLEFVEKAMKKGVILTPGSGFGSNADKFVRAAVTAPSVRIDQAIERLLEL